MVCLIGRKPSMISWTTYWATIIETPFSAGVPFYPFFLFLSSGPDSTLGCILSLYDFNRHRC